MIPPSKPKTRLFGPDCFTSEGILDFSDGPAVEKHWEKKGEPLRPYLATPEPLETPENLPSMTHGMKDCSWSMFFFVGTWWFKVTFLGWLSDPFKGLSDLQLGDEKVTLNHLVCVFFVCWVCVCVFFLPGNLRCGRRLVLFALIFACTLLGCLNFWRLQTRPWENELVSNYSNDASMSMSQVHKVSIRVTRTIR